jgi:type I restriction enzyme S subunit
MVPIGEIVDFIGGGTPSRDVNHYWNGSIPWASVKDFKGPSIDSTLESITHDGLSASSSALIPAGHVIMPTRMSLGKAAINSIDIAINQDLKALKPKARIDTRYLLHAILSRAKEIQSHGKGATVQGITIERLRAIQIPLPPLEDQRRIAAILDKASDISINIARAIQIEDELNASLFDEIIGDPVLNPHGFPRVPLIDLCSTPDDIKCGPFGTQLKQHEFKQSGVPLWGIKHVNRRFHLATNEFLDRETAERLSAYSLLEGDIVMTRKGTVGNCCVYPSSLRPGVMHSDLLRIRLDSNKCLPGFAAYQLHHSHDVKRQIDLISGGAIMAGINVGKLKSIDILVPSVDTQKRFESLVAAASRGIWQPNAIMRRHSLALMSSLSSRLLGRKEDSLIPQ